MKHLEVRQKYSAAPLIFNSLLSVSSSDDTLRLVRDKLHNNSNLTGFKHLLSAWLRIKHSCLFLLFTCDNSF